ncbi:hypothetical protein DS031_14100 [Bacillus taeanensis]|uniref:Uncharacterized protein n=1 Tax=Bacillus taeanensis TaxID=273032 RepID=A0A366XT73_9BACI|nr:hypothetical protein DS031_14100 [Bacillus taeanensis]
MLFYLAPRVIYNMKQRLTAKVTHMEKPNDGAKGTDSPPKIIFWASITPAPLAALSLLSSKALKQVV